MLTGHELLAYADRTRRILHVNDGARIVRVDFHGRVRRRGRRPADEKRLPVAQALHFLRHMHHFIERRRDQAGQADEIRALAGGRLENPLAGHHHAQVDHFEVVTLQHDADDVLADVMDIALDRGDHHLAVGAAGAGLFLLDVRNQHRNGLLHHARRLHHLRQEHLARTEQIAHHVHSVHQRTLDHIERPLGRKPRLFGILEHELIEPLHQRVLQALLDGKFAPLEVIAALRAAAALEALRDLEQPLGGIRAARQNDVLDALAQILGYVLVDRELTGIDDPHGQSGANGVVQEYRVHRLAHRVVAAEGKRHVADAAADVDGRHPLFDRRGGLDEIQSYTDCALRFRWLPQRYSDRR